MKILFLTSEVVPFCKTGGLADVSAALPSALAKLGGEVKVVCPLYRQVGEYLNQASVEKRVRVDQARLQIGGQDITYRVLGASLKDSSVEALFVDHPGLYDRAGLYQEKGEDYEDNFFRFAFFCRAALEAARSVDFAPDIVHLNEWQTCPAAVYLKTQLAEDELLGRAHTVLTIHNIAYQGLFEPECLPLGDIPKELYHPEGLEFWGKASLLKAGIVFSDGVTTVSPSYAREMQTPEQGHGLDGLLRHLSHKITGILNGVDYGTWKPEIDKHLPAHYGLEDMSGKAVCKAALQKKLGLTEGPNRFLVGMVSRLADQKGIDLVMEAFEDLMEMNLQLVILGTGEERYHDFFLQMARKYPNRFEPRLTFDEPLAHLIVAGSDALLMPSRYEPCGLTQLYSMRYGTVPIVRATGGLRDSVTNLTKTSIRSGKATGFRFLKYDSAQMLRTIERARRAFRNEPHVWKKIIANGMSRDFSWEARARKYMKYYRDLIGVS